jgi:hypothetical protein
MIVCDRLVRIYSGKAPRYRPFRGWICRSPRGPDRADRRAAGSGKSTLMSILAGLDTPTAGMCGWLATTSAR